MNLTRLTITGGGTVVPAEIGAYEFLDVAKALCRY